MSGRWTAGDTPERRSNRQHAADALRDGVGGSPQIAFEFPQQKASVMGSYEVGQLTVTVNIAAGSGESKFSKRLAAGVNAVGADAACAGSQAVVETDLRLRSVASAGAIEVELFVGVVHECHRPVDAVGHGRLPADLEFAVGTPAE